MSFDSLPAGVEGDKADPELQAFIQMESEKAKFQTQVHNYTDVCWEKCVDKPGKTLDTKTETCLNNCVKRFIDTTFFTIPKASKSTRGTLAFIECSKVHHAVIECESRPLNSKFRLSTTFQWKDCIINLRYFTRSRKDCATVEANYFCQVLIVYLRSPFKSF